MIAKKSADVNAAEADGTTALHWAANNNDTELALRLLKAGANAKVRNLLRRDSMSRSRPQRATPA